LTSASLNGYLTGGALSSYVLQSQTGNWNTAYSRGNHASAGYLLSSQSGNWNANYTWYTNNSWNALYFRNNSGSYYTKSAIDAKWYLTGWSLSTYATTSSLSSYVLQSQTGNRNTAYSRGDWRNKWFLTGEADPLYSVSAAAWITSSDITHWDTVYSRGDRRAQWFMTSYTETDPVWNAAKWNYVLQSQTGNRNTAYSRGNHRTMGYLTGSALVGYLTGGAFDNYVLLSATGNWNTAYSRGNHASAGYLLSSQSGNWNTDYTWYSNNSWNALYFRNNSGSYYTKSDIDNKWYLTGSSIVWYTIDVQATTSNPSASQTIYLGQLPAAPTATAATRKIYIRHAGTIKMANIYSYASTAGTSAATWSWYIRLNNTTDYLIQAVSLSASERVWSNSSLSIPVAAGDYVEIKFINPAWWGWWANPSGVIFGWYIYIE